jgi:hypothetical protein
MGFMTTLTILNDGFDQIQKHPEDFVTGIRENMNDGGGFGVGNHANCVEVMRSSHADYFRLFATQYNSTVELSPYSRHTQEVAQRIPDTIRSWVHAARAELDALEKVLDGIQS